MTVRPSLQTSLAALCAAAAVLAGCATPGPTVQADIAPVAPASAPPAANIAPADVVGTWGFASYHSEADRSRTETAARAQCSKPYVIGRGPTGGVMMHLADATQPAELRLKGGPGGRSYVGPEGPAADRQDREVLAFDGRVLILKWVDPEVTGRYGTAVYVRCGAPGTRGGTARR